MNQQRKQGLIQHTHTHTTHNTTQHTTQHNSQKTTKFTTDQHLQHNNKMGYRTAQNQLEFVPTLIL